MSVSCRWYKNEIEITLTIISASRCKDVRELSNGEQRFEYYQCMQIVYLQSSDRNESYHISNPVIKTKTNLWKTILNVQNFSGQ